METGFDSAGRILLAGLDRLLPGRIVGCYLVGSSALAGYRPGRSDVDFIAVVGGPPFGSDVRRLRLQHFATGLRIALRNVGHGQSPFTGTCNGVFVRAADLSQPVSTIVPIASQTGHIWTVGQGFDLNPVVWKVLAERGIAIRGPSPDTLELDPEPDLLRLWNLQNLESYWRPWALRLLAGPSMEFRRQPRALCAWGVLGAPRSHHTIATGEVISKEAAGIYALQAFDPQWHPLILDALAWRRREVGNRLHRTRNRARQTAEFTLEVVDSAHSL